jgi:hypothetical protein
MHKSRHIEDDKKTTGDVVRKPDCDRGILRAILHLTGCLTITRMAFVWSKGLGSVLRTRVNSITGRVWRRVLRFPQRQINLFLYKAICIRHHLINTSMKLLYLCTKSMSASERERIC